MSFTRFHDDPARIKKGLEQSTYAGIYRLTTPGQGMDLPFASEPQMRLTEWGANFCTNSVNVESDLRGLSRKLNKDLLVENNYKNFEQVPNVPTYRSENPFIEESRASHPAWMYKDLEQTRWETPLINPQDRVFIPFQHDIQTRILEKNNHVPILPTLLEVNTESPDAPF
jgi:hypothetical protein